MSSPCKTAVGAKGAAVTLNSDRILKISLHLPKLRSKSLAFLSHSIHTHTLCSFRLPLGCMTSVIQLDSDCQKMHLEHFISSLYCNFLVGLDTHTFITCIDSSRAQNTRI